MKTRCPYRHVQPYLVAMGDLHEDLLSIRSYSAVLGGCWRSIRRLAVVTVVFSLLCGYGRSIRRLALLSIRFSHVWLLGKIRKFNSLYGTRSSAVLGGKARYKDGGLSASAMLDGKERYQALLGG